MFDTISRNNFINSLDNKINDIKRDKKTQWPIKNTPNKITDYSNTNERRNYINMLSLKKELNEQSLNIDYQPFNPTLDQKSYFVNDGLSIEQINTLSKNDYDKRKLEIQNQFKTNLLSIVDPLLIDTIINNNLFKNSILTQKFINDRWFHFIEKLKKNYSSLTVDGFNGYAKEYIKKYNRDNNITILNDESYENKIKELKMDLLKLEKTDYLTEKEKEKNKLKINQIKDEISELEKMDNLNIETIKLKKAEEDLLNKKLLDDKLQTEQKYKDIITNTEKARLDINDDIYTLEQIKAKRDIGLIIDSQLEQINILKKDQKDKLKKETNPDAKKAKSELIRTKEQKESRVIENVKKAVEKMKNSIDRTKAEVFLNDIIIDINKAETKEDVESIDSEAFISESTAESKPKIIEEKKTVNIITRYNPFNIAYIYINGLYTIPEIKKTIKADIFKSNDSKDTIIQKILNYKPAVEDIIKAHIIVGFKELTASNIFTLEVLKSITEQENSKINNKDEFLKIAFKDDTQINLLNKYLKTYVTDIRKTLDNIKDSIQPEEQPEEKIKEQPEEQKGEGIKKLNKFQKKKIILGEIKAGNNNPLLLKFLKIK